MTDKKDESQIDDDMTGVADEYDAIEMEEDAETVAMDSSIPDDEAETSSPVLDDGGPFDDLPDDALNQVDDPYDPMAEASDTAQVEAEPAAKEAVAEIRADKKETGKHSKAKVSGQKPKFSLMSGKTMLAIGGVLSVAVLATIALAPGSPSNNSMAQQDPGLSFDAPDMAMGQADGQVASDPLDSMDPFAGAQAGQQSSDQFGFVDTGAPSTPSANPNFDPILAQEFCDPAKPQNIDIYLCTDMGVDPMPLEMAMGGLNTDDNQLYQAQVAAALPPATAQLDLPAASVTPAVPVEAVSNSAAPTVAQSDEAARQLSAMSQEVEKLKAELAAAKSAANKPSGEPVLSDSEMAKELKDLRHKNKLYIEENGRFKTRIAKLESDLKGQSSNSSSPSRSVSAPVKQESFSITGWTLSGVTGDVALFKSSSGESFVVREGEMVDGFRIIEIDSTDLVVKTSGGTVRLR